MDDVTRPRGRGNGQGTVYARPGKRLPWLAVLVVGWTPEGRPIRRSRSASSAREAKAMLNDMLGAQQASRPLPDDRLTVSKWLNAWLPRQTHLRPATRDAYDRAVRLLDAELGTVPLRKLRSSQVEATLSALGSRFAANSVANARSVLVTALSAAERDGILSANPARLARGPKGSVRGKPAPSLAEMRAVLAALQGHRLHALYVLMAATGLRVGEAMGLSWADFDGDTVRVRYRLGVVSGEKVHAPTKSAGSVGLYALPPVAVRALERRRALQAQERIAAGRRWQDTGLVFTSTRPPGAGLAESSAEWVLSEACRAAGVRHLSPHDLRRFAATAISDRVGRDVAQRLLGHTSESMTERYVSQTEDARRRAADAMQEALG